MRVILYELYYTSPRFFLQEMILNSSREYSSVQLETKVQFCGEARTFFVVVNVCLCGPCKEKVFFTIKIEYEYNSESVEVS